MIREILIYEATGFDPYENLAREKYLMDLCQPGQCILYLWQNQNTVVIGRNQNPWAECRTTLLEDEGGHLARRLSGGGAVFHDLGNLNFTFLMSEEDQNTDRQLEVIRQACLMAGIATEKSGRNDVLAEGRKFSGNAFYHAKGKAYHHGTILIHVNGEKLARYLSPPKAKLAAKGVSSVRSRVVNLQELEPSLTVETMKGYMKAAFRHVYGLIPQDFVFTEETENGVTSLAEEYGSWEYLYGTPLACTMECEEKFDWGFVQLQLMAKNGIVEGAKIYTDSMDWDLSRQAEEAITGCRFCLGDLQTALRNKLANREVAEDFCNLLEKQSI